MSNVITSIGNSLIQAQEWFITLPWYWQLFISFFVVMLIASAIANVFGRRNNGR